MIKTKKPEDNNLPQKNITSLEEKKKDPISQSFIDLKENIEKFSDKSGEFFLNKNKGFENDWQEF